MEAGLDDELRVARAAVGAAVARLAGAYGAHHAQRRKGAHDVVTRLDRVIEDEIAGAIRGAFPGDAFRGEEGGRRGPRAAARTWLVDPIDGSVSFASGLPFFAVSVALAVGEAIVLGIVADPLRRETFIAVAGRGAWRDPERAQLTVRAPRRSADAVIAGDAGNPEDPSAVRRWESLRPRVRALRTFGSIALSLAWLAAGRLDGVFQPVGLQAVDVAAGGFIARTAGALVTSGAGGAAWIDVAAGRADGIAAGRRGVHQLMVGR